MTFCVLMILGVAFVTLFGIAQVRGRRDVGEGGTATSVKLDANADAQVNDYSEEWRVYREKLHAEESRLRDEADKAFPWPKAPHRVARHTDGWCVEDWQKRDIGERPYYYSPLLRWFEESVPPPPELQARQPQWRVCWYRASPYFTRKAEAIRYLREEIQGVEVTEEQVA